MQEADKLFKMSEELLQRDPETQKRCVSTFLSRVYLLLHTMEGVSGP